MDDDLAEWVESEAAARGVSRAKIIRDAVETARITGLVTPESSGSPEGEDLVQRVAALEARVAALEGETTDDAADADAEGDIVSLFAAQLSNRPPTTEHGQAALVRVFEILLEEGPLATKVLRERLYPEFEEEFANAQSMWQSIQRYFDEIPGIEKVGYGEWDADPSHVIDDGEG